MRKLCVVLKKTRTTHHSCESDPDSHPPCTSGHPAIDSSIAPCIILLMPTSFIALVFGLAAGMLLTGCQSTPQDPPPHIIFVMADDLGYGDPGSYNPASRVPTPHMDRLAREGIRFTDAHSPSAVCTPTRYGVLTGRYAWRTSLKEGVLWGYSHL